MYVIALSDPIRSRARCRWIVNHLASWFHMLNNAAKMYFVICEMVDVIKDLFTHFLNEKKKIEVISPILFAFFLQKSKFVV